MPKIISEKILERLIEMKLLSCKECGIVMDVNCRETFMIDEEIEAVVCPNCYTTIETKEGYQQD